MDIPRFITIGLPIAAVQFALREALFERASLRPDSAIFPTIITFRLFLAGPCMFLYGAVQIAKAAESSFDYFLAVVMIGFAVMTFSLDQGAIRVSKEGVSFRRWYGLRKGDIAWKEVVSAGSSSAGRTITVFRGTAGVSCTRNGRLRHPPSKKFLRAALLRTSFRSNKAGIAK